MFLFSILIKLRRFIALEMSCELWGAERGREWKSAGIKGQKIQEQRIYN